MRYMAKLTCIAQCLAASLHTLHQAGLLTDEYYAKYIDDSICSPANDGKPPYKPKVFLRFHHEMRHLAKPIDGDSPLVADGEDIGETTACDYYTQWEQQSLERIQETLRIYVGMIYNKDSFKKRISKDAAGGAIRALTLYIERLLLQPEQLLRSYAYVSALIEAFDKKYKRFRGVMSGIAHVSIKLMDVVGNPQDKVLAELDDDTIRQLNALRMKLDTKCHGVMHNTFEGCFNYYIDQHVIDTAATSNIINDALINSVTDFCERALKHVNRVQERISENFIDEAIRIRESISRYPRYAYKGNQDPYMSVHLVYPEMDYEKWGSFWRAAQKQVANELEALQKLANEVRRCTSYIRKTEPGLFDDLDSAFKEAVFAVIDYSIINKPDYILLTSSLANKLIGGEIEVLAKKVLNLYHEEDNEKTAIDETASTGEPTQKRSRNDGDAVTEEP
ncbi:hypothetical protein PAPHI01_2424, partial [Pancytospora philotis]